MNWAWRLPDTRSDVDVLPREQLRNCPGHVSAKQLLHSASLPFDDTAPFPNELFLSGENFRNQVGSFVTDPWELWVEQ